LLAHERKRIGKAWIDKKGEKEKRTKKKTASTAEINAGAQAVNKAKMGRDRR
jgi:hypothetical protein